MSSKRDSNRAQKTIGASSGAPPGGAPSGQRIAISGKSGCGNTTVTRLVGKKLGLRVVNYTFRSIAKEMGITFEEVCELAEKDPKYDRLLDDTQVALAKESGIVLGSRLAVWLIEDASLKVYLSAPPEVRAQRIANREHADFKATYDDMMKRDRRDRERYIRLYRIDIDDYHFADLIIDAHLLDQHEITDRIVEEVNKRFSCSDR